MTIYLSQFGSLLVSRPAGRDAYLTATAYLLTKYSGEPIEIDFSGVKVATPSWLDEFITPLKKMHGDAIKLLPSDNATVLASLATIASPQH